MAAEESTTSRRATRVKICGITREADRHAAVRAGADALGFIVDVPVETPRELPAERAAELIAGTEPFVTSVVVTMPERVDDATRVQEQVGADVIQVHGGLSSGEIEALKKQVSAAIVVAVGEDDPELQAYGEVADALLVDSTDEDGGGGTGRTHDWNRTRQVVEQVETPVVLAGGLTPENVGEAIETVQPYGVDTATGVEREGGRKDHDAVNAFVRQTRRAGVSI